MTFEISGLSLTSITLQLDQEFQPQPEPQTVLALKEPGLNASKALSAQTPEEQPAVGSAPAAGSGTAPDGAAESGTTAPTGQHFYTVDAGDTATAIAHRFDVKLSELKAANPNSIGPDGQLMAGARLVLPGHPNLAGAPTGRSQGTVSDGQGLVAAKFGRPEVSVKARPPASKEPASQELTPPEPKKAPLVSPDKTELGMLDHNDPQWCESNSLLATHDTVVQEPLDYAPGSRNHPFGIPGGNPR